MESIKVVKEMFNLILIIRLKEKARKYGYIV